MTNKPVLYFSAALSLLVAIGVAVTAYLVTTSTTPPVTAAGVEPVAPIRQNQTPPAFTLENQLGEEVDLQDLKGKVVMITAVYATCHTACPTIITEAKSAVKNLTPEQQGDLAVVAITLDPEGDTREKRKATADAHGLHAPLFHYVNGESPDEVLQLVEELGWARAVNEETGEIGHSNMFVLIDRRGRIAYTVMLDADGEDLLGATLKKLLDEPA